LWAIALRGIHESGFFLQNGMLNSLLCSNSKSKKAPFKILGCLVTCYYAEKSSSDYIYAPLSTTLGDLRDQIHTKVKSMLEVNWGERDAKNPNSASIMISASKKEAFSLKMHKVHGFHNRYTWI
jgi:hypothetical protein